MHVFRRHRVRMCHITATSWEIYGKKIIAFVLLQSLRLDIINICFIHTW